MADPVGIPKRGLEGVQILVADDLRPIRRSYNRNFTGAGAVVTEAANASEAIAVLSGDATKQFDVVFSDFDMEEPGKNGLDVLRTAQTLPVPPKVRILHTGSEFSEAEKAGFLEEGILIVPKPSHADEVIALIRERLAQAGRVIGSETV